MTDQTILQRLRRFLLAVVAAIFFGSILELILLEHTEKSLQWIPFIVSALSLIAVAVLWYKPTLKTIRGFQGMMVVSVLTSVVGMYLHFSSNLSFVREINPSFSLLESIWPAVKGSDPLLAPGILLLAGVLGLAVVYRHPNLEE